MKRLNKHFIFPFSNFLNNATQLISLSLKDFFRNRCFLWAAALTYTTVFALIPLLAVSFSLFHAFGGLKGLEERIRPLILKVLVPGAQEKLISIIDSLIERLNAGAIGAVGTVLVFLAAIFLLGQLEIILNEIWGLKKHRPFLHRFALYWTAITFGPPLFALSIGIPATLRSYQAVMWLENYINLDFFTFLPYLFIWFAFIGLYAFIPNTKVQVYFMEDRQFFKPVTNLLYKARNGRMLKDNPERYAYFARVALENLKHLFWKPDIIVCNDWQMSFVPALYALQYADQDFYQDIKTVFLLHSANSNVYFTRESYEAIGISEDSDKRVPSGDNGFNNLELALNFADHTVTVFSPDGCLETDLKDEPDLARLVKSHAKAERLEIPEDTDQAWIKAADQLEQTLRNL